MLMTPSLRCRTCATTPLEREEPHVEEIVNTAQSTKSPPVIIAPTAVAEIVDDIFPETVDVSNLPFEKGDLLEEVSTTTHPTENNPATNDPPIAAQTPQM